MIQAVVREHHFSPKVLGDFYLDAADYQGLEYWYDDVITVNEEITSRAAPKKK